jgi:hypothetical protein
MESEKTEGPGPPADTSTAACGSPENPAIVTAAPLALAAGSASGSSPTLLRLGSSMARPRLHGRPWNTRIGLWVSAQPPDSERRTGELVCSIAGQSGRDRLRGADRAAHCNQTELARRWRASTWRGDAVCARGAPPGGRQGD